MILENAFRNVFKERNPEGVALFSALHNATPSGFL